MVRNSNAALVVLIRKYFLSQGACKVLSHKRDYEHDGVAILRLSIYTFTIIFLDSLHDLEIFNV